MNAPDDGGVLVGRWNGAYDDGTSPTSWTGSAEILLMYYYSGGTPVRYAQCWVYAGVLNACKYLRLLLFCHVLYDFPTIKSFTVYKS